MRRNQANEHWEWVNVFHQSSHNLIAANRFKDYLITSMLQSNHKAKGAAEMYLQILKKQQESEALVRWNKDGKVISPGKFIPLFEKNKFIIKLDLYIFEHVCKDLKLWKEKYNYVPNVSINVSKAHFAQKNFIEDYVKITNKYNIDRKDIDLEITESATIDQKHRCSTNIK